MRKKLDLLRNHDAWLLLTTCVAVAIFVWLFLNISPSTSLPPHYSQLTYLTTNNDEIDFDNVAQVPKSRWTAISSPINLGMSDKTVWFSLVVDPTQSPESQYLLHIDYALLDVLDVGVFESTGATPVVLYSAGDTQPTSVRPLQHVKPLFPLPSSQFSQRVFIKVKTTGTIRLPVRIWKEREFIQFTANRNAALGVFFGILIAMGISNIFLTVTTGSRSFLLYSGYVFCLALTIATLQGYGFTYIWSNSPWFQGRAAVIFASATIMFASMFTRSLLPIKKYSLLCDRIMIGIGWTCGITLVGGVILPYSFMIKAFLIALSFIVTYTLALGAWMAIKGEAVARYFTIAWGFLLVSALAASFDNVNLVNFPLTSNTLLIIGGAVETLILALILAINFSHSRDSLIDAKQFALEQEKQANIAKEHLLTMQQRHQEDLEYKVEERTLELEVTLRELSEVNQELERLNAIDPLTGVHNRRHFDKSLRAQGRRSRREEIPLSLIILDIDHFKKINDTYGHDAGDLCLKHTTSLFQQHIHRPSDDLCRIGGEEFAFILPNTDLAGATHLAKTIVRVLADKPFNYEGSEIKLTASAGVSTAVIQDEEQAQTLFRFADSLLFKAKQTGRNKVISQHLQDQL
ncbi:sensor domain-containing diguanylate cyclase [Alteromonas hispanica]|uniref:diguanylate cyclase n=1 Tax=Alteromonas hispanica TaxID=315421 RepID=A0A6L9MYD1_9ALTE|nr:diguanylate cyclase [Alteromonas hispanica]NDW22963.1 diguanylate cyclase [Alteromonas hispanica]